MKYSRHRDILGTFENVVSSMERASGVRSTLLTGVIHKKVGQSLSKRVNASMSEWVIRS
jgi:hypothetical protein